MLLRAQTTTGQCLGCDPVQHRVDRCQLLAWRQLGAVDHHNRQPQLPRGGQFGLSPNATAVLADHDLNAMLPHQRKITRHVKGSSRNNNCVVRQGRHDLGLIHQPQDVVVLRLRGKRGHVLFSQRQQNPLGLAFQRGNRAFDVRHMTPSVPFPRPPRRTGQRDQSNASCLASMKRVPAHLRGEWMRGVYHMCDAMLPQVMDQTVNTAKTTHTRGQWLRLGRGHTTGIRKHGVQPTIRHVASQKAGLCGAAKNKEFGRHVV